MKLLLDQNLSPKLVDRLGDVYPAAIHVSAVQLERAADAELWEYATENSLVIVTKDADFGEMSVLQGSPPKVIWIRRGNCSTTEIEYLLREARRSVEQLFEDDETDVLELY